VYEKPANVFVGGFIGSPSMNLIPVSVDGRKARASGFEIELPLAPRVDRGILGIRPEALSDQLRDHQPSIDARVDTEEVLGADKFVYGSIGADAIVARVDRSVSVRRGDLLRLAIDRHRLHFFEAGTGRAIL
jgi:multiple sugar transport system ATP-binding protein